MIILFDSRRPVKSDQRFGILPPRERRRPYTWQDLQDAAQMFGDLESAREHRQFDQRSEEAETQNRMERGYAVS
jgi:hypothetical protein